MSRVAKTSQKSIIIHYGEIGLKGRNRQDFINQLKENIEQKLNDLSLNLSVEVRHGYLFIKASEKQADDVLICLKEIFGIAWFAYSLQLMAYSYEEIENELINLADKIFQPNKSFAVRVNRIDKNFPLNSHEIEVKLGKAIQEKTQWQDVDLDEPNQTFFIEIYPNQVFFYSEKIKGLGGLPVGTAGQVLSLLSGGIDSPVAGFLAAKRGAQVDFLHFAANNMQIKEAPDYLISKIVKQLSKYTLKSRLFIVPYTHFNLAIVDKKITHELIIFRRFMARVAERLAQQIQATALITGDNLAQVASQTLPNLISTSKAAAMPMLRPLISYDKNETVELAKKISTYKLSIQPYKDCCSIISRHPKTSSKHEDLAKQEKAILPNYQGLINQTLNDVVVLEFENGKII